MLNGTVCQLNTQPSGFSFRPQAPRVPSLGPGGTGLLCEEPRCALLPRVKPARPRFERRAPRLRAARCEDRGPKPGDERELCQAGAADRRFQKPSKLAGMGRAMAVRCRSLEHLAPGRWATGLSFPDSRPSPPANKPPASQGCLAKTPGTEGSGIPLASRADAGRLVPRRAPSLRAPHAPGRARAPGRCWGAALSRSTVILRSAGEISLTPWHAPRTVGPDEKHYRLLIFRVHVL